MPALVYMDVAGRRDVTNTAESKSQFRNLVSLRAVDHPVLRDFAGFLCPRFIALFS